MRHLKIVFAFIIVVMVSMTTVPAFAEEAITVDYLIALNGQLETKEIISIIEIAPSVDVPPTMANLKKLQAAGVSKEVMTAVLKRKKALESGQGKSKQVSVNPPTEVVATIDSKPAETTSDQPTNDGVFYRSNGKLIRIESVARNTDTRGLMKTAIVSKVVPFGGPGVSSKYTYEGETAAIKVSDSNPEFYVKQSMLTSGDIVIAKLKVGKNERTFEYASINRFGFSKAGPKKGSSAESVVEEISSGLFVVRFKEQPEDGEYAIGLFGDMPRYPFSVQSTTQISQK